MDKMTIAELLGLRARMSEEINLVRFEGPRFKYLEATIARIDAELERRPRCDHA